MNCIKYLFLLLVICILPSLKAQSINDSKKSKFTEKIEVWNTVIADRERGKMDSFYQVLKGQLIKGVSLSDSLKFYHSLGAYQSAIGLSEEGLNSLYLAVKLARKSDEKIKEAQIKLSIGVAQYGLKNIEGALQAFEEVKNVEGARIATLTAACNNIAALNYDKYINYANSKEVKDSLIPIINANYSQSVALAIKDSNMRQLSATYSLLVPWYASRGLFDSAYYFASLGLKICEKENFVGRTAFTKINISKAKVWEGKASEALPLLNESIAYFNDNGIPDQLIHAWRIKAMAFDSLGMSDSAFALAHKMFYKQREIFNEKMAKSVGENRAKYQTSLKEIDNQKLKVENKSKQLRVNRLITLALGLLVLALGLFFYFRNRIKRNQILLQEQELTFKNSLIKSNMESEEKERRKIARELHDGIGQQISTVKMGLENLAKQQSTKEIELQLMNDMVGDVMTSVRNLSHQMMPVSLERFGLKGALESLVESLKKQTSIDFNFVTFNCEKLELDAFTRTQIYRVAQELVQNIVKHSKAKEASITLVKRNAKLTLLVADDGVGMDTESNQKGMGLMNIYSRASAIQAEFNIDSKKGETNMRLELIINE